MRLICPACESVFQSGARPPPADVSCPACKGRMPAEADVLELHAILGLPELGAAGDPPALPKSEGSP